ncbi:flagellar filament capping protein FliD [Bermanella marisrubri]|uniref:Filament cap protein n=1 Tax=Bermanella marisrubri TaxID=207949 RepID=Q1N2Y1_9GAMM|nr:flagellar filament capping protein FliD [Bermanella marisrubri]EAT12538.1 Flagellar capping protein [Oceanobacter sp. RED65] [Bermanella marisrubri]QIZ84904.1 flagellar filament capping protein FliD [Bermanella marisrubri]
MASIESLGIGSDLLTSDLVENIINADKAAGELRLDTKQQIIDAEISAYGEIQSKLFDFSESIVALADADNVGATTATSSDDSILTATASSSAPEGNYSVEVQRIAKAHSLVSQSFSSTTATVGTGTLEFKFGTTSYTGGGGYDDFDLNTEAASKEIEIDAGNNTLSGLRDAINNADFGVKASIIFDGSGYVLQMSSEETGENMSMEIVAKDASGALATTGLSAFAYNKNQDTPGTNMTQTQQGQDALINLNGLTVTRSSNTVDELIDGVTLNLKGEDVGKQVTVSVSPDIEGISEKIQKMVDTYNAYKEVYDDLTSFNADRQQGSLLLGDSTLRSIDTQIRSLMTSTVEGITGTNFRSFSELGIYTDQNDSYKMKFDASLFLKGIRENSEAVTGVFAQTASADDPFIQFMNESIKTKPGTYDINITQLATQGTYQGGTVDLLDFTSPIEINDANDEFSINVNGKTADVTLTQGSYSTGAELAGMIEQRINSTKDFQDRGYSVDVQYSASDKAFSITSNAYGSSSQVYFSSVDNNTSNTLGFARLGEGEFEAIELSTLNQDYFNGFGPTTVPGGVVVQETDGINFANSNASFSLSLNGGPAEAVTVNLNASGNDLNSDGVFGDRKDILQAIQTAIDGTALNGQVEAQFNDDGRLYFQSTSASGTDSIEITAVGSNTSDNLLGLSATDGPQINGKDPGLTFGAPVSFNVKLDGVSSTNTVTIPAGTYATGNDLATAIESAINTDLTGDASFSGMIFGATSNEGTRDISTNIDFSAQNAGFTLNVNGNEQTIIMDADSGNNITDIQAKLDAAYGAGVVTAQLGSNNGLELVTNTAGREQYIQVVSDGRGAFATGTTAINAGIDFETNNANFDLVVDGTTLNVNVERNASSGDKTDSLSAVQEAIDASILASGQFAVGDIVAKLDSSDNLIIETVSKNGVKTANTFGSSAQIDIQNADANAQSLLGLPAVNTNYTGGYDALGMDNEIKFGSDIDADVRYEYDPDSDKGQLIFNIGGQGTTVGFESLDPTAISFLGMYEADSTSSTIKTGLDVQGTINGVEASGSGQFLRAQDGNQAATNGYYVAGQSDILNGPVTIDGTNDTFTIEVDGVEAVINVAQGTYATGASLAKAVQDAINETYEDDDISVKVDYTDDTNSAAFGTIGIISASTGASSEVLINDINAAASTVFGFVQGRGDGEAGKAKVGDVDDASGLRIKVTGGALGERGSVSYVTGIADRLKDILQGFLDPEGGLLDTKFDTLDKQQEQLDEDRESFEARISAQEARLKSQFLYNDSIIATLKTTENYLKQQFEAMAAAGKS